MSFRTIVPRTAGAATAALADVAASGGRPLVIGGGTITVPRLLRGELRPTHVVDLGRIGADEIWADHDAVHLGAMISYQRLIESPLARRELPLLHQLSTGITGGIQIRNQGTIGGSATAARPYSDAPTALAAHEATLTIASAAVPRAVTVEQFLAGPERPRIDATEILTVLSFPRRAQGTGYGYYKLKFAESSWPVVTAACAIHADGTVTVTLGGVTGTPGTVSLTGAAGEICPRDVSEEVDHYVAGLHPEDLWADLRAGAAYRQRVAGTVAARAFDRALAQLQEGDDPP